MQWGLVIGGLFGVFVDGSGVLSSLVAGFIGGGLLWISHRISDLKAGRTFTPEQIRVVTLRLKDKPKANFQLSAYGACSDAIPYCLQLEKPLKDAGWKRNVMTVFYADVGEDVPTGITIIVGGQDKVAEESGRHLEAALKEAQVEDVKLLIETRPGDRLLESPWVLIKFGRKGNQ